MKRYRRQFLSSFLASACVAGASAQPGQFRLLPLADAYGITADGLNVVGDVPFVSLGGGTNYVGAVVSINGDVRYLSGYPHQTSDRSLARSISPDGRYVAGWRSVGGSASQSGCAVWDMSQDDPLNPGYPLPTAYPAHQTSVHPIGLGVSSDGSLVVGAVNYRAAVWYGVTDPIDIAPSIESRAVGVTPSGTHGVGFTSLLYGQTRQAFIWSPSTGLHTLPTAFDGPPYDTALAVSDDGMTIAGYSQGWLTRWVMNLETETYDAIPVAPIGDVCSEPTKAAISADGRMIGGTANSEAAIWSQDSGLLSVRELALQWGIETEEEAPLTVVGISADRRRILVSVPFFLWNRVSVLELGDAPPCPPLISQQPAAVPVQMYETAVLRVGATGQYMAYQWTRNGEPLRNDGRISGAMSRELSVANAASDDAGDYAVIITSACGTTISDVAVVSVIPPGPIYVAPCGNDTHSGTSTDCELMSGPKRTIQAAIDAASPGDTVLVLPGVYTEAIDTLGKRIALRSTEGATATIIDATGTGRTTIICQNAEGTDTLIEGFTITGGVGTYTGFGPLYGGGVFCYGASPRISDCVIADNHAGVGGGYCGYGASPLFSDCTFDGNTALLWGGAVLNYFESAATFDRCVFRNNFASEGPGGVGDNGTSNSTLINCLFIGNASTYDAAYGNQGGSAHVVGCVFVGNTGAAICTVGPGIPLIACTLTGNITSDSAGIVILSSATSRIDGCIVHGNIGPSLSASSRGTVRYSNIEAGYVGAGNIDVPPLFFRTPSTGLDGVWGTGDDDLGDLRLRPGSLCIDTGDATALPMGITTDYAGGPRIVGPGMDIGAFEFQGCTCAADVDCDGVVNSQDFFHFISALLSLEPVADFNRDGLINSQDYFDFLHMFFAGC